MRRKSYIMIFLIFITSCSSPVYQTIRETIPPAQTEYSMRCLDNCNNQQYNCSQNCEQNYQTCLQDQKSTAEKNFSFDLMQYNADITNYNTELLNYNLKKQEYENENKYLENNMYEAQKLCAKKGIKKCEQANYYALKLRGLKKPEEPEKPQTISLHTQIKKYQSLCKKKCDCDKIFEQCFISCGGQIKERVVCIKNCQ